MAQADASQAAPREHTGNSAAEYPEIRDIGQDINALRNDIVSLSRHLQRDGRAKASEVKKALSDGFDTQIRDHPWRTLAFAFLTGFAANLLMRRR